MPTFISLVNWTDQGVRAVTETAERARAAEEAAGRMGGRIAHVYWTLGGYDIVVVSEFPDDETATAFMVALGRQGNVRTTTMRAYDADEMRGILGRVG